jgi:cytochrome b6-f complex iron-sulfur subunit
VAETPEPLARRTMVLRSLQAGIAATIAAVLYPVGRFLWPRATTSSGAMEVVAPYRVDQLKPDANGNWPPPFDFDGKPCLLIRTPDDEIKAFNAVCTHVQCTVEFRPATRDIFCNCHNGVYDLNGRNVSGPPPRPLETYKVDRRGKPGGKPGEEEIIVSRIA